MKVQNAWLKIMRLAKVRPYVCRQPVGVPSSVVPVIFIIRSIVYHALDVGVRIGQLEEIRKEVEIISQSHERDVDRKDAVLQMLDRDVDEAEEQYQVALRQHLRNIDSFIDIHVCARRVPAALST